MFENYFKAACMVIMLFVFYEKSFDRFHTKNIYRLNEVQKFRAPLEMSKLRRINFVYFLNGWNIQHKTSHFYARSSFFRLY